jgi:hypothetical protein
MDNGVVAVRNMYTKQRHGSGDEVHDGNKEAMMLDLSYSDDEFL